MASGQGPFTIGGPATVQGDLSAEADASVAGAATITGPATLVNPESTCGGSQIATIAMLGSEYGGPGQPTVSGGIDAANSYASNTQVAISGSTIGGAHLINLVSNNDNLVITGTQGSSNVTIYFTGSGGGGNGNGSGSYQVDVYANGSLVLANATLNFLNTASINVNVAANGSTANINLSANLSAIGIPAIETALASGNSAFGSINSALSSTNSALTTDNAYFGTINSAFASTNAAFATDNTYFGTVNSAFSTTNTAISEIEGALAVDNTYFGTVNSAISTTNSTFSILNTAITGAASAANDQGTYANGTVVVANIANLNFNNTASINVAIAANGHQTNVGLSVNTSGTIAVANSSNLSIVYESNGQIQLDFAATNMNLTNLGVGANIAVGNVIATGNLIASGNLSLAGATNLTYNVAQTTLYIGNSTPNTTVLSIGGGRSAVYLAGQAPSNDAAFVCANNTGFITAYMYGSNTAMDLYTVAPTMSFTTAGVTEALILGVNEGITGTNCYAKPNVQTLVFCTGWANYDAGVYQSARYWIDPNGVVHLGGVITGASAANNVPAGANSNIATLPAAAYPANGQVILTQWATNATGTQGLMRFGVVQNSNGTANLQFQAWAANATGNANNSGAISLGGLEWPVF